MTSLIYIGGKYRSKLSEADVATIRRLRRRGISLDVLAERFEVSRSTVGRAAAGQAWRGVTEPAVLGITRQREYDPMFEAARLGMSWAAAKARQR